MQKFTASNEQTISFDNAVVDNNDNIIGVAGLPGKALPSGAASLLSLSLERSYEVSFNELCRQLAFRSAGDRTNFDVMRLAYSLLTYVTAADSLCGTAGREVILGAGPSPGTTVSPPNKNLITKALSAFFDEQTSDGMWDKGQPIYKSFRKTGRNVGNAFVFATDTLGSLLTAFPAEAFRPHLHNLEKTISWIEHHQTTEYISNYCDPESGQCYGKPLRGWCSPHISPNTGPQAWSTAQTLTCITKLRSTVRELMHDDVLAEFGGIRAQDKASCAVDPWDRLLDSDLGDPSSSDCSALKQVLESRILTPFSASMSRPSFGAAYSTILFGPPGTAKTTICEALAQRMGWDFVVIDTAAFLADGLSNVAARIQYVFERLRSLDRCIILFDEIEEFCLDRESPGLGMESRMLTTAMLTAINDLRRAKRSIFFLATNRLRAFDSAITRPGRFDMQLFVGTPNLNSRCIQLQQKLATTVVDEETKETAEKSYRIFLESVWAQDAMFMNYLEGLQFASTCANIVASGDELTEDVMSVILANQAAVMTVRGSARDEVIASMNLSRF
uniref:AAA+ ATPase domain-containing protein n=1 Tax=Eucampia antarctica TaxID=49252 RepID=A0A7S2R1B7_9STRA|mmetsp:Transcript_11079/g.10610  ORF Transcript_11079/g.10610 Transcript_11079/m.10610 type:complete len:559 (+) Transcript_11079:2-1678(+)